MAANKTFIRLCKTVLGKKNKTSSSFREIQQDIDLNKLEGPDNVESILDSIVQTSARLR